MDTEVLVDSDIELGKRVADELARDPVLRVRAVLWWFDESRQRWLFLIGTSAYELLGAQAAYHRVRAVLEEHGLLERLPLDVVWIVSERHPILEAIRSVFGGSSHLRLKNIIANGVSLADVYLYFVSAPQKRRVAPKRRVAKTR